MLEYRLWESYIIFFVFNACFLVLYYHMMYHEIMNNINYKSNNNVVYSCKYHIV